jgi:hypothetical protein
MEARSSETRLGGRATTAARSISAVDQRALREWQENEGNQAQQRDKRVPTKNSIGVEIVDVTCFSS